MKHLLLGGLVAGLVMGPVGISADAFTGMVLSNRSTDNLTATIQKYNANEQSIRMTPNGNSSFLFKNSESNVFEVHVWVQDSSKKVGKFTCDTRKTSVPCEFTNSNESDKKVTSTVRGHGNYKMVIFAIH